MKKLVSFLAVLCAVMLSLAFVSCSHDEDSGSSSYAFKGKTYSGVYSDPDVGTVTILLTFSASGNSGTLAQSAGDYSDVINFTYTVSGNAVTLTSPDQDEPMTITYSSTGDTFTVAEVGLTLTRT
ncbi:MAG: hypothetical protein IKR40_03330 [Treponema sp.]|nr:hypothetical protein [Treponema sp.]